MAAKKILVAVGLLALVALAAAGPPLDKKERNEAQKAERKAAAEQRRAEFEKKVGDRRWGGNTRPHDGVSEPAAVDVLLSAPPLPPPLLLSCPVLAPGRMAAAEHEQGAWRAARQEPVSWEGRGEEGGKSSARVEEIPARSMCA